MEEMYSSVYTNGTWKEPTFDLACDPSRKVERGRSGTFSTFVVISVLVAVMEGDKPLRKT